jgi:YD repeat-containing protein
MKLQNSPSGNITSKIMGGTILESNGSVSKYYDNSYTYRTAKPHAPISIGNHTYEWTTNGNMRMATDGSDTRYMFWDEENRLTTVRDDKKSLNYYTYDAAGERTLKLTGNLEEMNINGQYNINVYNINNYTLYTNPYMVVDPKGYTKHYYIESERFVSKIGGGMADISYGINEQHGQC